MSEITDKLQTLWERDHFRENEIGVMMNLVITATLDQERRLAALEGDMTTETL